MTIDFTGKFRWLACSLLAAGTFPVNADLLYDNSSNDVKLRFNPGTTEIADEITLAAPGFLTNFSFEYYAVHNGGQEPLEPLTGTIQGRVVFYNMDGPLFNGNVSPGTPFWTSAAFTITEPTQRNTLWFNSELPENMLLPQTFTWSVQFSGQGVGDEVGVDLYNPVTVGSSAWDYWRRVDGTWSLAQADPVQPINFASRFEGTVPEPTVISLIAAGGLSLLLLRRQKRG